MQKVIECKKIACPGPVIRLKKEIDAGFQGTIEMVLDNVAARENVLRFAKSQKCRIGEIVERDGIISVMVFVGNEEATSQESLVTTSSLDQEIQKESVESKNSLQGVTYIIGSDAMGAGDDELGRLLLKGFLTNLVNVEPLPQALFFYNEGVVFTTTPSEVLDNLIVLEQKGIAIYTCGTCTEYHGITDKLRVGVLGNIYDLTMLMQSEKVITL